MSKDSPFSPPRSIQIHEVKNLSPRTIEHYEELQTYDCCCTDRKTDSRLLKLIGIYLIVIALMAFAAVGIYKAETCEEQQSYVALLSLIIGLVIPHP